MQAVVMEGRTVIFVSHNMAAGENLCDRRFVIDAGRSRYIGNEANPISYYNSALDEIRGMISVANRQDRMGSGEIRVIDIEF